jgi:hypothetical protein
MIPIPASARPEAIAAATARCVGSSRAYPSTEEGVISSFPSMTSSRTRVPAPRCRFTYRTPGRRRSARPSISSGFPGATISPCDRSTSRTTATSGLAPPKTRSRYGRVYSPVSGSSRCDPAMWHRPSRRATSPPSDPTFDDARVTSGLSARSADDARSSTRSCDPIATIVPAISSGPRSNSTETEEPAWCPSIPAGTTSSPSARTSDVSTPAPRGSGVATREPPTEPSRTRTQSSMPSGDASLRASRAATRGRWRGGAFDSSASSGTAKMSNVSAADTG